MREPYSLSTKLSITTSIIASLMVIGIAIYALVLKHNELKISDMRDLDLSMTNTVLTLNNSLAQTEASVHSNTWLIDKCIASGQADSVTEVIMQLIGVCPEIESAGVVIGIDTATERSPKPYMYFATSDTTAALHTLPTLARDARNRSYAWLRAPLLTQEGRWSGPHADLIDGRAEVCTYVVPVDDTGAGERVLFFADIPVQILSNIISADLPRFVVEAFMLDDDGLCVTRVGNPAIEHEPYPKSLSDSEIHVATEAIGDSLYSGKQGVFGFKVGHREMPTYYEVINQSGWTLYYVVDDSLFESSLLKSTQTLVIVFLLMLVIMYLVLSWVIKRITRPLRLFSDSAIEISKGNFHVQLPPVPYNGEMRLLHDSFDTMQRSLVKYMQQIEENTRRQAFIKGELQIASRIQDDLLPKMFPPFPQRDDINVHATLLPAKQIGGDLYNYFIRDDKLFFIIADVSGKSVPAALVMAIACTVFNTVSSLSSDPSKIMHELNATTCANNEHSGFFITALVGVLDLKDGTLSLCNAGHDPAIIINPDGTTHVLKLPPNLPAGVRAEHNYGVERLQMEPGSRIVLYTDGITEAENSHNEFYGRERLLRCIKQAPMTGLSEFVDNVVRSVQAFSGNIEQNDDLTLMVIAYNPSTVALPTMLTIKSEPEEMKKVQNFCRQIAEILELDAGEDFRFNLVMEESISNIINHAKAKPTHKNITIYAALHGSDLTVIISDQGKPFDPTLVPDADTMAPLEKRPVGGLGITLLRKNTSSMEYRRLNHRNYLTLHFDVNSHKISPQRLSS